ncbi:hypothetical protein AX15_005963 [Amanita polypyramis BW_CC]|nr:hypothetical protein AX15_005963 [Amanita polypyramis BW_CC]
MEAFFDTRNNVLNAHICATRDSSAIYTVTTSFGFLGSKLVTILKDANPPPGESPTVGAINWKDRYFEVHAHRKPISEIKRKDRVSIQTARYWKWSSHGREYQVSFGEKEWQVLALNDSEKEIVGTFSVPFRPHLIRKATPLSFDLSRKALEKDEVFLILLLIYSEAKRQENSNFGPAAGAGAW